MFHLGMQNLGIWHLGKHSFGISHLGMHHDFFWQQPVLQPLLQP